MARSSSATRPPASPHTATSPSRDDLQHLAGTTGSDASPAARQLTARRGSGGGGPVGRSIPEPEQAPRNAGLVHPSARSGDAMTPGRLEAFSDAVIAIVITIMVLDLHIPHGSICAALRPLVPVFLTYVLSFVFLGIYWNNHHHLLAATETVTAAPLGEPAPPVLALAVSIRDGLDGREPFRDRADRLVRRRTPVRRDRVLRAADGDRCASRARLGARPGARPDWKGRSRLCSTPPAVGLAFVSRWIALESISASRSCGSSRTGASDAVSPLREAPSLPPPNPAARVTGRRQSGRNREPIYAPGQARAHLARPCGAWSTTADSTRAARRALRSPLSAGSILSAISSRPR